MSFLDDAQAWTDRHPDLSKVLILVGGAVTFGAVIWWFAFRKPEGLVLGASGEVIGREAQTVEELTGPRGEVPIIQTPEIHLEMGRSVCEDLLIKYNGASRSYPALANRYKAQAKEAGCGWAQ